MRATFIELATKGDAWAPLAITNELSTLSLGTIVGNRFAPGLYVWRPAGSLSDARKMLLSWHVDPRPELFNEQLFKRPTCSWRVYDGRLTFNLTLHVSDDLSQFLIHVRHSKKKLPERVIARALKDLEHRWPQVQASESFDVVLTGELQEGQRIRWQVSPRPVQWRTAPVLKDFTVETYEPGEPAMLRTSGYTVRQVPGWLVEHQGELLGRLPLVCARQETRLRRLNALEILYYESIGG